MDKIFTIGGFISVLSGFLTIGYQGLRFLTDNAWNPYTVLSWLQGVSPSMADLTSTNPGLANALESCPLSGAFIALGLLLLFIGSKIKNRYA